jgi:hypothetical protein
VQDIFSTPLGAFAVLTKDHHVIEWGHPDMGGDAKGKLENKKVNYL